MIKARFDDATLLVTPAPLTVVLDGTRWGPRQAEIAATVVSEARRAHAETTLFFWSLGESLAAVPLDSFAETRSLSARGRFVTPLVESGLPATGSLVCFVGGRVPDWDDWSTVYRRFQRRVSVLLAAGIEALPETAPIKGTVPDLDQVERAVIAAVLGARVTSVALRFKGCAPICSPSAFVAREDDGCVVLEWTGDEGCLTVDVAAASDSPACRIEAHATGADGESATAATVLRSVEPDAPRWHKYGSNDGALVLAALSAYRQGTGEHACARCGCNHHFERAFRCERGGGSTLFAVAPGLPLPAGVVGAPGDRIALRVGKDTLEAAMVGRGAAVWFGDSAGVRGSADWMVVTRDGSIASRLDEVWPALFAGAEHDLWIVES